MGTRTSEFEISLSARLGVRAKGREPARRSSATGRGHPEPPGHPVRRKAEEASCPVRRGSPVATGHNQAADPTEAAAHQV